MSDRPRFLQQPEILELIPKSIMKKINNPGDIAQLLGFEALFIYLERPGTDDLRERIETYFWNHRDLRGHLSKIPLPHYPDA